MICDSTGKICYESRSAAERAAVRFKGRSGHQLHGTNHPFYCRGCSRFHIGHGQQSGVKRYVKRR